MVFSTYSEDILFNGLGTAEIHLFHWVRKSVFLSDRLNNGAEFALFKQKKQHKNAK